MAYLKDLEDPNRLPVISPDGKFGTIDKEEKDTYIKEGFRLASIPEVEKEKEKMVYGERDVSAFAAGAVRGVSFGLSDALMTKTGLVDPETLRKLEEHNLAESIGGEMVGSAASLLIPGGQAAAPVKIASNAAKLSRFARLGKTASTAAKVATVLPRAAEQMGLKVGGIVSNKVAQKAIAAATEGILYGGGHLISREAIQDPILNSEYAAATIGLSALGGAAIPLAGSAVKKAVPDIKEFIKIHPRTETTKVGVEAAAETIAKEYRQSKGMKSLLNDIDNELKDGFEGWDTAGMARVETEIFPTPGGTGNVVKFKIVKDFTNGETRNSIPLFQGERQISDKGITLLTVEKPSDFLKNFKGIQNRLYKDIEIPAFQAAGYAGKGITTAAANIATARNFAKNMEDVFVSYPDIRAAARKGEVGVSDVIGDIENKTFSGKIRKKEGLFEDSKFYVPLEGNIPKPEGVLKKLFKKTNETFTKVDEYTFSRMLDDEKLFNEISSNENIARSVAKEIVNEADEFHKSWEKFTDEIIGDNKIGMYERFFPKTTESVDALERAMNPAVETLETMKSEIDEMISLGGGEFGFQNKLKQLSKKLEITQRRILNNKESKLSDMANLYKELDVLKRDIGKTIKQANRQRVSMSQDFATLEFLQGPDGRGGIYQTLRAFLEDEDLFGKAANVQKTINEAWYSLLANENFRGAPRLFVRFGKDEGGGFFDKFRADQDAFESFFKSRAEDRSPLQREYINEWLNNTDRMVSAVSDSVLDKEVVSYINMTNSVPKIIDRRNVPSSKKLNRIHEKYLEQKDLYDAYAAMNKHSSVFVPFLNLEEKQTAVHYAASSLDKQKDSIYARYFKDAKKRRTAADMLTGLEMKRAAREAKEKSVELGTVGGIAGGFGGGVAGGVLGAAGGATIGSIKEAATNPETLIKRYHQIKGVADKLGGFATKVKTGTGKAADKAVRMAAKTGTIATPPAAITSRELFRSLYERDVKDDDDFITGMTNIDPVVSIERIADNLEKMTNIDPDVAEQLAGKSVEQLSFLQQKVQELSTGGNPLKGIKPTFSRINKKKLDNYIAAIANPLNVLETIAQEKPISPEAVEVLVNFYPEIYRQVLNIVSELDNSPRNKKIKQKLQAQQGPSISTVQGMYAPKEEQQQAGGTKGFTPPKMLDATRLTARR